VIVLDNELRFDSYEGVVYIENLGEIRDVDYVEGVFLAKEGQNDREAVFFEEEAMY
jgi:hypothetical protein